MKRLVILLAILFAFAAGACRSCPAPRSRGVVSQTLVIVSFDPTLDPRLLGQSYPIDASTHAIDLDLALVMNGQHCVSVVIHELWHAAGYGAHINDGSYSSAGCARRWPDAPTVREVEDFRRALSRHGPWLLRTPDPRLVPALAEAARFINHYVGATVFRGP